MTTPAHTPGPWVWHDRYTLRPAYPDPDKHHIHTILKIEDGCVAFIGSTFNEALAEDAANQSLLEASPALLDAAEAAVAVLSKGKWSKGSTDPEAVALYKLIDAIALAKAPREIS